MLTSDCGMQLSSAWRRPGSRPTVLIHLLNAGSSGKQLLDRLLQTASCRQMEGAGKDNVKKFHSTTFPPAQLFTNHCPQFSPLSLFSFHSHTSPSLTEILSQQPKQEHFLCALNHIFCMERILSRMKHTIIFSPHGSFLVHRIEQFFSL